METTQLKSRIAALESHVDLLEAELFRLHEMLMQCGFPEGIKTLKATVEEYLEENREMAPIRKSEML
jgi:hypothetical protein